jgi:hypothetical protein
VPKEYVEVVACGMTLQMNDFRTLVIYDGRRRQKVNCINQDKGFRAEFEAFKHAIRTGKAQVDFSSIYNTSLATFKILESLKTNAHIDL